jgi:DNA-binding LytR/AlgR family response regulator
MRKEIILVEDEKELAENYSEILEELGYNVLAIFDNSLNTLDYLTVKQADLILIDIKIKGEKDGIALAKIIHRDYGIPVIFTTAYSSDQNLEQAFESSPINYLVKPISRDNFKAALYLAFQNPTEVIPDASSERIKIRTKGYVFYLLVDDIVFLKADGLYSVITTKDSKTYLERGTLKEFHQRLPANLFVRVHKSFLINLRYVNSFNARYIELLDYQVPMRRGFYSEFKSLVETGGAV